MGIETDKYKIAKNHKLTKNPGNLKKMLFLGVPKENPPDFPLISRHFP
jgi:hypothetical protein